MKAPRPLTDLELCAAQREMLKGELLKTEVLVRILAEHANYSVQEHAGCDIWYFIEHEDPHNKEAADLLKEIWPVGD